MILVDANLLVYAFATSLPEHERARAWLDEQLSGTAKVALPWPSLLAFLRLVPNPRVFARPASLTRARAQVESWLSCAPVWIPQPTDNHWMVLGPLLEGLRPGDVPDAHLAALAIEHGLELCSTDAGFARYVGLRWRDPLRS